MSLVSKAFSDIVTFSRSSNATRIGPTGLVEYAPHNLLTYSEQLDNAAWSKEDLTVTANAATAPDGTVTADLIVPNTSSADHSMYEYKAGSGSQTFSVYAKVGGYNYLFVGYNNTAASDGVFFDLSAGTVSQNTSGLVASISNAGNGWYRCSVTKASGFEYAMLCTSANGTSFVHTGDGTSGIYLWGAQLSVGPYALDYTPTTSAAVYGPRFDYDPVTLAARGLLIEEQRTNLLPASNDFSNVTYWTGGGSVTANATTSPDGTVNATIGSSINPASGVGDSTVAISGSIFAKANPSGASSLVVRINRFGSGSDYLQVTFNLSTGVAGAVTNNGTASGGSASMTSFGNGWYRCVLSGTVSTTAGTLSFNPQSTCFIYGAQLEAGSFATSYIPTVASSVTRSADVASVNTLSPWFSAVEGTLYAEGNFIAPTSSASKGIATLVDNVGGNDSISIFGISSSRVKQETLDNGVSQASYEIAYSDNIKAATAFKLNDVNAAVNGTIGTTDTSATVPTVAKLQLGGIYNGTSFQMNGWLRRVAVYPRRLTNAELQALTA
jgi:hypothetical protein